MTDIPVNSADSDSLYADHGDGRLQTLSYKDEEVTNLLTRREARGEFTRLRKENVGIREELKSLREVFLKSRGNGNPGSISESSELDWASKKEEAPVRANDASPFGADVETQGRGERRLPYHDVAGEDITNDDDTALLPHDTFSFLAFAKPLSSTFMCGIIVFATQVAMLVFLTLAVFQTGSDGNRIGVPPNVTINIRALQIFTLVLTVLSQDDIHQSLNVFYYGYEEKSIQDSFRVVPSRYMWSFSLILRLAEGMFGLIATFLLVMTESSAKEILLNFTAITFISFLDDTGFIIANWGYFGKTLKESARAVKMAHRSPSNDKKKFPRVVFLLSALAGMFFFWGFIFYKQANGDYLCSTVFVQFDDEVSPALGTFTGLYDRRSSSDKRRGVRQVEYVEQRKGSFDGSAILGYCTKESAWTISFGDNFNDEPDACQWHAKSSELKSYEADSYDLLATSSFPWFTRNVLGREVPMEHFHLSCYDCKNDAEFCGGASRGSCVKNRCQCVDGWYGYRCEHQDPCPVLEIDSRNDGFLGSRTWSNKYNLLRSNHEEEIVHVYGHPVYLSESKESFDVIFFTGRRWALTLSTLLDRDNSTTVADYFDKEFHGHWSNYNVAFLSQPVDVDTVTDASISPKGLSWFQAEDAATFSVTNKTINTIQVPNNNRPSTAVLLCGACDNATNPCFYEGVCNKDGSCTCVTGSTGVLCQESPNGNGLCNPFFNIPEYGYDGGDCCMASCTSTEDFKCGKNVSSTVFGIPIEEYVGYPNCRDPRLKCDSAHDACWKPSSMDISGESRNAETGHSVSLSGTGEVLAVAEPGASRVRVFSQDGMQWTPRGQILEGPSGSRFGIAMTLSNDGQVVAIGAVPDRNSSYVQVFEWQTSTSDWSQRGEDIDAKASYLWDILFLFSVSLSKDGNILAIGSPGYDEFQVEQESEEINNATECEEKETYPPTDDSGRNGRGGRGRVRVYSYSGSWEHLGCNINDGSAFDNFGQSVALSGNGEILAIGATQHIDENDGVIRPGYVSVYKLEDYKWNRIGNVLSGIGAFGDHFGWSVSLSSDGSIVAIGNAQHDSGGFADSGQVQIYQFKSNAWMQLGGDLSGNRAVDNFGWSVSLSSDGYTIAVGAKQSSERSKKSGYVNVFKYDAMASQWNQQGQLPGFQASLSDSGALLAIGAPYYDGDSPFSGRVRVYGNSNFIFPNRTFSNSAKPADALVPITVSLQFDSSPEDIELNLVCGNITLVAFGPGTFNVPDEHVVETFRVEKATECRFTITDAALNGMCCSNGEGNYVVYYGDDITKSGNALALGGKLFRSREEVVFIALPPSAVSLVPITVVLQLQVASWETGLSFRCGDTILSSEAKVGGFVLERLGLISQTFLVEEGAVCHFEISDQGGLCCSSGFGFYELYYGDNVSDSSNLIAVGAQFNNTESVTFRALPNSTLSAAGLAPVKIIILLDASYSQTTFRLKCGSDVLLDNLGTLVEVGDVPIERTYFVQEFSECLFEVFDTGGDGICCENGTGYIQIYTGKEGEEVLIYDDGEFGFGARVNFTVSSGVSAPIIHVDPVLTLPAPRCSICEDGTSPCYPDNKVSYVELGRVVTCGALELAAQNLLEGDLCSFGRASYGTYCGCGIECGNKTSHL